MDMEELLVKRKINNIGESKKDVSVLKMMALSSAKAHLKYGGLSVQSIIKRLELEGYTEDEIDYAISRIVSEDNK